MPFCWCHLPLKKRSISITLKLLFSNLLLTLSPTSASWLGFGLPWSLRLARHFTKNTFLARFGMHLGIVIASVLISVCYYLIWMDLEEKIKQNKHLQFLYIFALSHSSSLVNTANIIVSYFNFPNHKGGVVCLLQAYYLLNGYVFGDLNKYFFDGHSGAFMWLIIATPLVTAAFWLIFVTFRHGLVDEKKVDNAFTILFFLGAIVVSVIIFTFSIISNVYNFTNSQWWLPIVCDVFVFLGIFFPVIYQVVRAAIKYKPTAVVAAAATNAAADEAAAVEVAGLHESVVSSFRALLGQMATFKFWVLLCHVSFQ
ncbi:hypothetical protein QVD17_18415 [Tagetes erecta]|uniref:Nodulin-like domain-containing protein n=1 Tax=Tagetes erecta TaxID=13708 RepID=A0AAD8NNZ2_TARER|nr:hypothetical protein QVD17_18415 [Tagetes erecta]